MKLFKREKDRDSSFLHRIKEIKKKWCCIQLAWCNPHGLEFNLSVTGCLGC